MFQQIAPAILLGPFQVLWKQIGMDGVQRNQNSDSLVFLKFRRVAVALPKQRSELLHTVRTQSGHRQKRPPAHIFIGVLCEIQDHIPDFLTAWAFRQIRGKLPLGLILIGGCGPAAEALEPLGMESGFLYKALRFVGPGDQIDHLIQQDAVCRFRVHLGQHLAKGMVSVIPVWIIDFPRTANLPGVFSG